MDSQKFLGKTIKLNVSEVKVFKDSDLTITQHRIDDADPIANEIRSSFSKVRIVPPGVMITMDLVLDRHNFFLNEDGVIFKVTQG